MANKDQITQIFVEDVAPTVVTNSLNRHGLIEFEAVPDLDEEFKPLLNSQVARLETLLDAAVDSAFKAKTDTNLSKLGRTEKLKSIAEKGSSEIERLTGLKDKAVLKQIGILETEIETELAVSEDRAESVRADLRALVFARGAIEHPLFDTDGRLLEDGKPSTVGTLIAAIEHGTPSSAKELIAAVRRSSAILRQQLGGARVIDQLKLRLVQRLYPALAERSDQLQSLQRLVTSNGKTAAIRLKQITSV